MYHSRMDIGDFRQQLLNWADGALEDFMYDALGSSVDTLSLTDMFQQLEELAVVVVDEDMKQVQTQTVVPEVEKTVYDALDSKDDTLFPTDVIGQFKEQAVVVANKDMKQEVVPLLYGDSRGQEGGGQGKTKHKTFARCEEPSCQFNMELEVEVSAQC